MSLQNVSTEEYENNASPRVGDKVRLSRDIEEGIDCLYEVLDYMLGRVGNKVLIQQAERPLGGNFTPREYYFYCLCPQPACQAAV